MSDLKTLMRKYYVKGGRYSYYPFYQSWDNDISSDEIINSLSNHYDEKEGVDLYIHIPFCRSLCTFCGCNIKVTENDSVSEPYVESLIEEWKNYCLHLVGPGKTPRVSSIYIGGGTPTFLPPKTLKKLLSVILKDQKPQDTQYFQGTIEIDPRGNISDHLKVVRDFSFNRIMVGVQDFNSAITANLNRRQSSEEIAKTIAQARKLEFAEVLIELIYGLPLQTTGDFVDGLNHINTLGPEGVILYPLAHVPWQKAGQDAYGDYSPLTQEEKIDIYLESSKALEHLDMEHIGMGHFFSPNSRTKLAFNEKLLRRNIMGFFPRKSRQLIPLGNSSIGQSGSYLIQNDKVIDKYQYRIKNNGNAITFSHRQSPGEEILQNFFERIVCQGEISSLTAVHQELFTTICNDGLVEKTGSEYQVTKLGRHFLKNICQAFDPKFRDITAHNINIWPLNREQSTMEGTQENSR